MSARSCSMKNITVHVRVKKMNLFHTGISTTYDYMEILFLALDAVVKIE